MLLPVPENDLICILFVLKSEFTKCIAIKKEKKNKQIGRQTDEQKDLQREKLHEQESSEASNRNQLGNTLI